MNSSSTISALITRPITPETKGEFEGKIDVLSAPMSEESEKPEFQFEAGVFNYLFTNRESLGIRSVMRFTNLLVDGAVELEDGKRLTVEAKYRMNWTKACQAEWQFRNFVKRNTTKTFLVNGGLVFFEQFQGDGWHVQAKSRFLENGWSAWYRGHSIVDGMRLDLLRLRDGKLESFPMGDAIVANAIELTDAEKLTLEKCFAEYR